MFYKWRKRQALQQAAELRKQVFGTFDMTEGDVEHENIRITLQPVTLYTNGRFAWQKALVITHCAGCGISRSADFGTKYALSGVMEWANMKCGKCVDNSEHRLKVLQDKLRQDDERRQELTETIKSSSGTPPGFSQQGQMDHPQFRWISVRAYYSMWFPTWLAQDGSAEALQQLHELARQLKCSLHAHEGLLLFTPIHVMNPRDRQEHEQEIEKIQTHLAHKAAYQATGIAQTTS